VLIILAVLWGVVLVPPLLRSRSQRNADSIVDFNYKLDVLGQTNVNLDLPQTVAPPPPTVFSRDPLPVTSARAARPSLVVPPGRGAAWSAKRRRDLVRGFSVAITVTLLIAVVTKSPAA